jgi:hypothetical protein
MNDMWDELASIAHEEATVSESSPTILSEEFGKSVTRELLRF